MTEQWKWIVYQGHDFTGKYQVSNLGRIKGVERTDGSNHIQRELGFCQVSISRCCRRQKKSGIIYGFLWDFAEGRDQKHDDQTGSGEFSGKEAV